MNLELNTLIKLRLVCVAYVAKAVTAQDAVFRIQRCERIAAWVQNKLAIRAME